MIRFIHGWDNRAHVDTKNLRELSWLSIADRVRFFRMSHLFRIRHKLAPSYLLHNFKSISDAHTHNTRGSNVNYVLSRELSLSPTSFSFLAIKQWNELPNDIKSIREFRVFKRKLKEFFISQYDWTDMFLPDGFYTLFWLTILFLSILLRFNESFLIGGPLWKKVTLIRLSWAILESKLLHVIVCVIFGLFSN